MKNISIFLQKRNNNKLQKKNEKIKANNLQKNQYSISIITNVLKTNYLQKTIRVLK